MSRKQCQNCISANFSCSILSLNFDDVHNFRLNVGQPNCTTKKFEITHNDLSGADNLDSVLALSPNGYLLWSDEGSVHQVPSQDFCIDQHK